MMKVPGQARIDFARRYMPVLDEVGAEFARSRPFEGLRLGVCLHVEPKTGVLVEVLRSAGAELFLTGSPGTTQDDIRDVLSVDPSTTIYGRRSDSIREHRENISKILAREPHLVLDNGADLLTGIMAAPDSRDGFLGGTEETTTGANRLREGERRAGFPVIVINDSPLKRIIENEHGVGQTAVESFMRLTNLMVPARRFVVVGYGYCGRGIARTLKSLGGRVAVAEIDPVKALEAAVDGMTVSTLEQLLDWGQAFFTATGRQGILGADSFGKMRDGAVLANVGHFGHEIDRAALATLALRVDVMGEALEVFEMQDGRRISVLASAEMVNLAGGGGNPIETMDLGLTLQAMSLSCVVEQTESLVAGPQPVPSFINEDVARRMLAALGGSRLVAASSS